MKQNANGTFSYRPTGNWFINFQLDNADAALLNQINGSGAECENK